MADVQKLRALLDRLHAIEGERDALLAEVARLTQIIEENE